MKNMVGDFANYARGPALRLSRLNLHQLIREVLGLYEANAIPIALNLDAPRCEVNGDATRLRQVIHNLLQNAQDALQGAAQPQISLRTALHQESIQLSVEDNGAGFPENALARAAGASRADRGRYGGLAVGSYPLCTALVFRHAVAG